MYGSDSIHPLGKAGLKQLVGGVRKIQKALGDGRKKLLKQEKPIAKKLREHLYKNF